MLKRKTLLTILLQILIRKEAPEEIKGIINEKKFLVKGSPGMGNWAQLPWIGIFNPKITTSHNQDII